MFRIQRSTEITMEECYKNHLLNNFQFSQNQSIQVELPLEIFVCRLWRKFQQDLEFTFS